MIIWVDEKCFTGTRDPARAGLLDLERIAPYPIHLLDVPSSNRINRPEFVAVAGLGIAAVALLISYFQLRQGSRRSLSRAELVAEIDAYLRLRGVSHYTFVFENGFENIEQRNGRPCIVQVRMGDEQNVNIYFGATDKKLWVSAVEADWRQLT
jgi:hypothetical protein